MTGKQLNANLGAERKTLGLDEEVIDLLGILRNIIAIRKILYRAAGIGLVLGIFIALSVPKKYMVQVILSPEVASPNGNNALAGLAASFLGNGAAGKDGMDALNISLSSDIVSSTPFLLELSGIRVLTLGDVDTSLAGYIDQCPVPWWGHVVKLPGIIIAGVKSLFDDAEKKTRPKMGGAIELTKEETEMLEILRKNISAIVDKKTGMTQVLVTLPDPQVSAIVADSVIQKLKEYIVDYQTSKAKDDCLYLERLFQERREEYYIAQKKYADYVDTHDNLILQSVRTEQERLQNDMTLAYQVYSQVTTQLQVARAKVQEVKPVFAIVEPAVVPLRRSGPGLMVYVLMFMFLSVVCAIAWVFAGKAIWNDLRHTQSL